MRSFKNSLPIAAYIIWATAQIEAKTTEVLLDHTSTKCIVIDEKVPEWKIETPEDAALFSPFFEQLIVENMGDTPLSQFFPAVNCTIPLTLNMLATSIASETDKVAALAKLWRNKVFIDDEAQLSQENVHPLDLINYKGVCTSSAYQTQFLNLCRLLGIEMRKSRVEGYNYFDFYADEGWTVLNPLKGQFYLNFDNERLVSSEQIMDDPLLLLRSKKKRNEAEVNFAEAWKELSCFDILNPVAAEKVRVHKISKRKGATGFTLFPQEKLIIRTATIDSSISPHSVSITEIINLDERKVSATFKERFPFPIQKITNQTDSKWLIVSTNQEVLPGETVIFEEDTFELNLSFDSKPSGTLLVSGLGAWSLFCPYKSGQNNFSLQTAENNTSIRFSYEVNESTAINTTCPLSVDQKLHVFDHISPSFDIKCEGEVSELMWWQISSESNFSSVPEVLDQVQNYNSSVVLSPIAETFITPDQPYYFRCKSFKNGIWSEWSTPFTFTAKKPEAVVEVAFEEVDNDTYRLDWGRRSQDSDDLIEYLVFGSNSIDFIPSVYTSTQINAICGDDIIEAESCDNLIAVTQKTHLEVNGQLAYLRIIAKRNGQLSPPSPLIHVYDNGLIQPRSVLQKMKNSSLFVAKRTLFPSSYSRAVALPLVNKTHSKRTSLESISSLLQRAKEATSVSSGYEFPDVAKDIWEEIGDRLLPSNHPAWSKLNRLFCKVRATQSPEQFKRAGFRRWRPGKWSRVAASAHPEFPEYFIKAYCDSELGILYDWKKWLHRIRGAETIRACIKEYNLSESFKVPRKWIYPLPKNPSPPNNGRYIRKNFILVCENMRIQEHETNEKMYKTKITKQLMNGLYTILQVCGLNDSVYVFNMPFCKDGKIAIIDTEYHHKWPVPFQKLNSYFSRDLRPYWEKITHNGGKIPSGIPEHNPPRMDRRDIR